MKLSPRKLSKIAFNRCKIKYKKYMCYLVSVWIQLLSSLTDSAGFRMFMAFTTAYEYKPQARRPFTCELRLKSLEM